MAYTRTSNIDSGRNMPRGRLNEVSHAYHQSHSFSGDLGVTAVSLKAWLESQVSGGQPVRTFAQRTHVEFCNPHATAKIYLHYASTVSTTSYMFRLDPSGGYVKLPISALQDVYLVSDTASTPIEITELG